MNGGAAESLASLVCFTCHIVCFEPLDVEN